MSKASREWKEMLKENNNNNLFSSKIFKRKEMTLKAYKKAKRLESRQIKEDLKRIIYFYKGNDIQEEIALYIKLSSNEKLYNRRKDEFKEWDNSLEWRINMEDENI